MRWPVSLGSLPFPRFYPEVPKCFRAGFLQGWRIFRFFWELTHILGLGTSVRMYRLISGFLENERKIYEIFSKEMPSSNVEFTLIHYFQAHSLLFGRF